MNVKRDVLRQALTILGQKVSTILAAIWEASGAQITEVEAVWTPPDKPRKKHRARRGK